MTDCVLDSGRTGWRGDSRLEVGCGNVLLLVITCNVVRCKSREAMVVTWPLNKDIKRFFSVSCVLF